MKNLLTVLIFLLLFVGCSGPPETLDEYVESLSGMTSDEWNRLECDNGTGMGFYRANCGRYLVDDSLPVIAYQFLHDGHFSVSQDTRRYVGGKWKNWGNNDTIRYWLPPDTVKSMDLFVRRNER